MRTARPLDVNLLPSRAFDSPAQREQTADIFAAYNETTTITPGHRRALQCTGGRARAHASAAQLCRTAAVTRAGYVAAPAHRDAEYRAALVAVRPAQCGDGVRRRIRCAESCLPRPGRSGSVAVAATDATVLVAAIVAYCVLRSLLLATIEAPEARYTIEVFPMLCILAGAACACAAAATREQASATSG